MQISLGKALCTFFFNFGGVKKGNPLRRVLQSLTKEQVGGGLYWMGARAPLGGRLPVAGKHLLCLSRNPYLCFLTSSLLKNNLNLWRSYHKLPWVREGRSGTSGFRLALGTAL